jgi:hypothetical protein
MTPMINSPNRVGRIRIRWKVIFESLEFRVAARVSRKPRGTPLSPRDLAIAQHIAISRLRARLFASESLQLRRVDGLGLSVLADSVRRFLRQFGTFKLPVLTEAARGSRQRVHEIAIATDSLAQSLGFWSAVGRFGHKVHAQPGQRAGDGLQERAGEAPFASRAALRGSSMKSSWIRYMRSA